MINILLIDDHEMVLEGMRNILSRISNVNVVAGITDVNQTNNILSNHMVDIVFLDINMPEMSGIELCAIIKAKHPQVKVIALSSFVQRSYVSQMVANGASGYIVKSAGKEEIDEAIHAVMQNKLFVSHNLGTMEKAIISEESAPILTRREKEILLYISQGFTNKEIAEKICVSQSTVDTHRKNLLTKFNVQNTAALITDAAKKGVLS